MSDVPVSAELADVMPPGSDFNPLGLTELVDSLGQEGAREIIQALCEDAPEQLRGIEAAFANDDRRSLQRQLHTIKGSVLLLKADALASGVGTQETAVAGGQSLTDLQATLPPLLGRYETLLQDLHTAFARRHGP